MKLQILDLAKEDLIGGFHFYEDKEKGLGDYFLTNLFSDIESLKVFGGHPSQSRQRIPPCSIEAFSGRDLLHD